MNSGALMMMMMIGMILLMIVKMMMIVMMMKICDISSSHVRPVLSFSRHITSFLNHFEIRSLITDGCLSFVSVGLFSKMNGFHELRKGIP